MKVTSTVAFITNEKLKVFIKEVQDEFKELLEETKDEKDYAHTLHTQSVIRYHIIKNQKRIDFSSKGFKLIDGHPKSMPSFFGLYLMVVSDLDHVETIEDVMMQIHKRYIYSMGKLVNVVIDSSDVVFDENELHDDELCCCSHLCHMHNMKVIKNKLTNYSVVIGCNCIYKYNLIDKDIMLQEKKKTVKYIEKKKISDKIKEDKKLLKIEKKRVENEINEKEKKEADRLQKKITDIFQTQEAEIKVVEEKRKWPIFVNRPFLSQRTYSKHRTYLDVNYDVKDVAKEYGAWYDPDYKKWYIPSSCKNREILLGKYHRIPDPR
jgi:Domain of unknown function (DUF5710)